MNYDNSVPKKVYVYRPLNPWGYNVLILNEGEEVPSDCTTIVPPNIDRPKFNFDTQKWESVPEPPVTPSKMQRVVMQQSQQITLLQTTVMQQNQINVKLQATKQQQENQIGQLQQLFMLANQQQAVADKKGEN